MKKFIVIMISLALLLALVFTLTPLGTIAMAYFSKIVAGLGQTQYTDEVTVSDIKVKGTKVEVSLTSVAQTQVGTEYAVKLYLNDVLAATLPVSWSVAQIPGTTKKITFAGLTLTTVTDIYVEVIAP